jgi:hypothetical protein
MLNWKGRGTKINIERFRETKTKKKRRENTTKKIRERFRVSQKK